MRLHLSRMGRVLKACVIGFAFLSSLALGAFQPELQAGCQSFDLKTSAVVSLGFSSALCMVIYDHKKDKNHY